MENTDQNPIYAPGSEVHNESLHTASATPHSTVDNMGNIYMPIDHKPPIGSRYEVMTVMQYVLLLLVGAIPVINLIVFIVLAFTSQKVNLRNYAIASLVWVGIALVLVFAFWGALIAAVGALSD